jgi:hypothetical protein
MDFTTKNNILAIESEKKAISLQPDFVDIDGLKVEMAWEYEKSGFLAYAHEASDLRIYQMRIEGYTVGFIPMSVSDLTPEQLDFLWDLDVLVMPTSKSTVPLLEKIEPSFLVTYGESAHELATALGVSEPHVLKYKLREVDLSGEKMWVVVMGE